MFAFTNTPVFRRDTVSAFFTFFSDTDWFSLTTIRHDGYYVSSGTYKNLSKMVTNPKREKWGKKLKSINMCYPIQVVPNGEKSDILFLNISPHHQLFPIRSLL